MQSLISLFGLAIAFACVSLAVYWNHYEQTYDSFLGNYDKIYRIGYKIPGKVHPDGTSHFPLHSHLKNNYSEVDKACGIGTEWDDEELVEINNHIIPLGCTRITPEAVDMFNIQWSEGNGNMNSWKENEVAISEQVAKQMCGKKSPIGFKLILKKRNGVEDKGEYRIVAVFKTWPKHSNFKFNVLKRMEDNYTLYKILHCDTYVCLNQNADSELFLHKLAADTIITKYGNKRVYNVLTPLKRVHYTYPEKKRNIRLDDVKLFTGAASLLSICALLNYLTLFVSRLRNRGRDMALRTICGSSSWQMGLQLMMEYLLLLFGSLFFSMMFIELFFNCFVNLAQLEIDRSTIYAGCGYLLLCILVLATILSLVPIFYFKQKTLRVQIESVPVRPDKNHFRILGVCVQLFISMLLIFCATIMIKQVYYLVYADINIERKNIAMISSPIGDDLIMDILKKIPLITETVPTNAPLFPAWNVHLEQFKVVESKENITIPAWEAVINQEIAEFYDIRIKEGSESFDLKPDEYLINETFAKQLGSSNPIGKTLSYGGSQSVIKGIVYDYQNQPPTEPIRALVFRQHYKTDRSIRVLPNGRTYSGIVGNVVAFKYLGDFVTCQAAIEKAFEKVETKPGRSKYIIKDGETVYNSYLTSEFNLLKLLNIITVISLLIALFGVYTLILQECERQRKNIAVRKVFGAQVKDILMMFFKEYMMQVVIAAALAFPIGYVLMKRWLEGYSRQTSISIEVFLGIFVGMAVLILLCIGWHVWRAANENPATAVKKE